MRSRSIIVFALLVPAAAALSGCVAGPAPEIAVASASPDGARRIAEGDTVSVDVTQLLDGRPWKTTKAWVGQLIHDPELNPGVEFNASAFAPAELVAGGEGTTDPVLAAVARALVGRLEGEHFTLDVPHAYGAPEEVQRLSISRHYGPYEQEADWTHDEFEGRFGAPVVGAVVSTNRLFNSTVVEVSDHRVVTRSNAQDGGIVALPSFNSLLRVGVADDGVRFRLDPVENVSFRIPEERSYFGLGPGHYVVHSLDEDVIEYDHHPTWSPILVGLSFQLEIDIRAVE